MARKNFSELRDKMSPESQERSRKLARAYREQMALDELREARDLTQEHLATILNVKQSAISRMERRTDMYVSTLNTMIRAMGGQLKIHAIFPEGHVEITQFRKLRRGAG